MTLTPVYWVISAILWFWHQAFSFVFGADSGVSWILAIVFLTWTIRILLVKPMLNQMRSSLKMQEMQPQMAAIKERYKGDQQKIMEETRKLQKELGVNPVAGCLPMLVQMPVFIGLFHVLRSFNRTGHGVGQLGLSAEQNREIANYIFPPSDVQSFLDASIFGVPLSAYIKMPAEMFGAFSGDFSRAQIAMVAVPLILITALATHFNAKMSVNRQRERIRTGKSKAPAGGAMAGQMEMMNKMMIWVMPFTILITGVFWHIGLLFYMGANNIWTYFQQKWLFAKLDKEEEEALQKKKDAKRATAPQVGVKPVNPKKLSKRERQEVLEQQETIDTSYTPSSSGTDKKSGGLFGGLKDSWRQMKESANAAAEVKSKETIEKLSAEKAAEDSDSSSSAKDNFSEGSTKPKPGQKPQNKRKRRRK